ncbi:MAG: DUF502 domain-containing protein [Alphaproteobacteria bacterium]|nr:DUF502 domain-containing protein [Alphaproteobacteria bacterium]
MAEKNFEVRKRALNIRRLRLERERAVFMKLGAKLRAYLFTGILVTAPVAITFYMAYKFIFWVDRLVNQVLPPQYKFDEILPVTVPGIGLVILVAALILVGMFAAGFLGRFFLRLGEWLVYKMPLVSTVYSLLKQVFETFFSSKTQAFKKVVMLEYPRKGIWILGFVSAELQGEVKDKLPGDMVGVFIPTTPNPTSGFLIFVPREDVTELSMSVEEGLKYVVTGGLAEPDERKKRKKS